MKRSFRALAVLPVVAVMAACASSGGGGQSTYTRDLGRQLVPTLEEARLKMWNKHNWALAREQVESQNIYWESSWREFDPPVGAAVTGPEDARLRILIRGRRVAGELDGGALYRTTFVGEYQVRGGMYDEWTPMAPPREAQQVFQQVLGDIELEIRTGVRR